MEKAAAQKGIRQLFFVVGGDDNDRALFGADGFTGFVDVKLHTVQLLEQVVGEFDICLVDFINQQDHPLISGKGFPQFAGLDVVSDVLNTFYT